MGTEVLCEDQNIEYHLVTLFEKLESVRREHGESVRPVLRLSMQAEVRTLEFWRSIISECLASFFYVFIVCGAAASGGGASSTTVLATALASGFAMSTLTHCFYHISGAHVNPAVSVAMLATRHISPVRALMFVSAQCGGGIAGAAALYGISVPGYHASLNATVAQLPPHLTAWERFGVEFILSFVVVFTYFVCAATYRKWLGSSALSLGSAYLACTLVSMPSLNPARSLGPAFVMNKWENHWVYWFGPLLGGIASGMVYEFIFNPKRHARLSKESIDGDSSSIHSDEDTYDELEKPAGRKFPNSSAVFRSAVSGGKLTSPASPQGYCPSLTSASVYSGPTSCKVERVESLYGGTKSLYTKSPPLTRANLNRSQSVYTKVPRPAHSLYPMHLEQVNSQNVHNQKQALYGRRPDSMYGVTQRRQDSQDSTYGSYQSNRVVHDPAKKNYVGTVSTFEGNMPKPSNYAINDGAFDGNGVKTGNYEGGKRDYNETGNSFDNNVGNYDDVEKGGHFELNPLKLGAYDGSKKNFVGTSSNFEANKKNYVGNYEGNAIKSNYIGNGGNFEGNRNGDMLPIGNFDGNTPPKGNFEAVKSYPSNGPLATQENNLSPSTSHNMKGPNHSNYSVNVHGKQQQLPPPTHYSPVGSPPITYGKYPTQSVSPRLIINPGNAVTSYHHASRHSPSPQY